MMRTSRRFLLATLAVLAGLSASAWAEGPKMRLERADVTKYPLVQLYLSYAEADGRVVTGKAREDFKLIVDSQEQGTASDVKTIEQVGTPIYLVMVAQVSGAMTDVFEDVKRGLKNLAQSTSGLKGSQVGLLAYAQDVKTIADLGKPQALDAKLATLQIDPEGLEVHLLEGVRSAINMLNAKGVPDDARKMIVIFSDGIDASSQEKKAYVELGRRALQAGIVINTIGYASFEATKLRFLGELAKQSNGGDRQCKTAQDVPAQFSNVADEFRKQYVAVFQSNVVGDGKEHTFQVVDDKGAKPVYSNTVTKICENPPPPPPPSLWDLLKKWWWVFVALPVAILLIALVLRARRAVPQPMAEIAPPMVEQGPMRTIQLDVAALGKGPTIGWIVGLTGTYADRTFKLKNNRTLIGTAPDADVVIDDKFMSAKHCEVRYDGNTFRIFDLGSTNGVMLNDKKVLEHDLVDGDTLRLGRTEFRFKSIN
ncbi:MAG TPA: FHA domain-containing protein [Polyangia bacterium]|nr:FHA domain-containing protein [Polyangia bacterium]